MATQSVLRRLIERDLAEARRARLESPAARAKLEEERARLTGSFRAFIRDGFEVSEFGDAWFDGVKRGTLKAKYIHGWHIDAMADHLQAVATGQIKRLLLNVPPDSAKSQIVCVLWPDWLWAREAWLKLLFSSYSESFTKRDSRKAKALIESDWYSHLFPNVRLASTPDTQLEYHTTAGGERHGASTDSGVTGKHVHCIPAGTMVRTERGDVEVSALVAMKNRPRVLSYNHRTGRAEWKRVRAVQVSRADELFEIRTGGGRALRATGEHPIYIAERGYIEARRVAAGAEVRAIRALPDVRGGDGSGQHDLPGVLPEGAADAAHPEVPHLRAPIREGAGRVREVASPEAGRQILLLAGARPAIPGRGQGEDVSWLRREDAGEGAEQVLLASLHVASRYGTASPPGAGMRHLRGAPGQAELASTLLLQGVRRARARREDAGRRQLALPSRAELLPVVRLDEAAHPGAGPLMRLVRLHQEAGDPPHQRGRDEQRPGEPDHALRHLPRHPPQVSGDTVSVVGRESCRGVLVYDLQVEGNHNFFANEILVHNCIVEDDPLKAQDATGSPSARDQAWAYHTEVLSSRLLPTGLGRVMVMQRLHPDDPSGRILRNLAKSQGARMEEAAKRGLDAAGEDPNEWVHLCLPMEFEEKRRCHTRLPFVDPRKEDGELLWPERVPRERVEQLKSPSELGASGWAAQGQQRPGSEEDSKVPKSWWLRWRVKPERFEVVASSWDMKLKAGGKSWVSGQVWGRATPTSVYKLHAVRFRGDLLETLKEFLAVVEMFPEASAHLVEDAANGPAVISLLKSKIPGLLPISTGGASKEARLDAVKSFIEARNCLVPENEMAPWKGTSPDEFMQEVQDFPNGGADDQVDACSQALFWLFNVGRRPSKPLGRIDLSAGVRQNPWDFTGG